jgi:hypothetical protein
VRTAPIPLWAKVAIDAWVTAAGLTHGRVFRAIDKSGTRLEDGMSPKVLWDVVRAAATRAHDKLVPYDLRRRALVSVIWLAPNWIAFNCCWARCPSRRRSGTSAASRDSGTP